MKSLLTALTAFSITLQSYALDSMSEKENSLAYHQLAIAIADALRRESAEQYTALFPSVGEFQSIMRVHTKEYGPYLKDAQDEFAIEYTQSLLPAVKESFEMLMKDGKDRNIQWSTVQVSRVEVLSDSPERSLSIVITSGGKEFKLEVEKIISLNGQLRVSQFVKLI